MILEVLTVGSCFQVHLHQHRHPKYGMKNIKLFSDKIQRHRHEVTETKGQERQKWYRRTQ